MGDAQRNRAQSLMSQKMLFFLSLLPPQIFQCEIEILFLLLFFLLFYFIIVERELEHNLGSLASSS